MRIIVPTQNHKRESLNENSSDLEQSQLAEEREDTRTSGPWRFIIGLIFLLGLIYLILPGPEAIEEFSRLPISQKSQLAGDTIQNPNIAAYYSDYDRNFVTSFYRKDFNSLYCKKYVFGFPNPLCFVQAIKLNHPPERAFDYIRDQQESTFLEEYLLPFRESFFVNGYEPINKNGVPFTNISKPLEVDKQIYFSKTTIRFYPTSVWARVLIYLGIWGVLFIFYQLVKRNFKKKI